MRGSVDRTYRVADWKGEAVSASDDALVAWLTARIEQAEREAPHAHERGCFAWDDYHYRHGRDLDDPQPTAGDACECAGPLRAMARVEAERAILAADAPDYMVGGDYDGWHEAHMEAARWFAWGHRYDAPGFLEEWAPHDAKVTT